MGPADLDLLDADLLVVGHGSVPPLWVTPGSGGLGVARRAGASCARSSTGFCRGRQDADVPGRTAAFCRNDAPEDQPRPDRVASARCRPPRDTVLRKRLATSAAETASSCGFGRRGELRLRPHVVSVPCSKEGSMIVGVIGSGSIGPDLAYGFVSALAKSSGSRVYLLDIKKEALDAGVARIRATSARPSARGKLSAKAAKAVEEALVPTMSMADLASCDYVLEAASEDLKVKQGILGKLEAVVRPDCLIGFATSGIPACADRGRGQAPGALLRQPPVLSRLARAADRGRPLGRRGPRGPHARDVAGARQGADHHGRRGVLCRRRRLLQLLRRGRADLRRRDRHAGANRQDRQRCDRRRRPVQRDGSHPGQPALHPLPRAHERGSDRQRLVHASAGLRQDGPQRLARPEQALPTRATTRRSASRCSIASSRCCSRAPTSCWTTRSARPAT